MSISISSAYGHSGGKLYVPVSNASLIYSHFDHVSGVAAKKGQSGVSISKIQILNTLIDHLSSIKAGRTPAAVKSSSPEELSALIENYQSQIKQAVSASQNSLYGLAGAKPETGVLFNFEA